MVRRADQPATLAEQAWQLMLRHVVKALPVVEAGNTLLGIVTMHDFFVGKAPPQEAAGRARVSHVMTRRVETARPRQPIVDLMASFADNGRHHLSVVDDAHRLVGMVTQSDMVGALFRAGLERPQDA